MSRLFWLIVERYLRRGLPPHLSEPALGDLLDDFAVWRQRRGRVRAVLSIAHDARSLVVTYRREVRGRHASSRPGFLYALRGDWHHVWRAVRARPATVAAVTLVLGLGIGLLCVMFVLADPFLFKALPYNRPHQLVTISLAVGHQDGQARLPTLDDWQARADLFSEVAAYEINAAVDVALPSGRVALTTASVSDRFLTVLAMPIDVEWPTPASNVANELPAIVVRGQLPSRTRSDAVVGRVWPSTDGQRLRLIAVFPDAFLFPNVTRAHHVAVLIPLRSRQLIDVRRRASGVSGHAVSVVARVQPGVTPAAIDKALSSVASGVTVTTRWLSDDMTMRFRSLAIGCFVAGVMMLLVCAANVANIVLSSVERRAREFAMHEALGAPPWSMARKVLLELGLVAAVSTVAGILLAHVVLRGVALVVPGEYVVFGVPQVTGRAMIAACTAGTIMIMFGSIPAWSMSRLERHRWLRRAGAPETPAVRNLRRLFASAQCAISLVLLVGAVLLTRSYLNLLREPSGLSPNVLVISASYPVGMLNTEVHEQIRETVAGLRSATGVASAAAAVGPLLNGMRTGAVFFFQGQLAVASVQRVTPTYFDAIGARLAAGRVLSDSDGDSACVVNRAFLREHASLGVALGSQITSAGKNLAIVGVIDDMRDVGLDNSPTPTVFTRLSPSTVGRRVSYVIKAHSGLEAPAETLHGTIATIDSNAVILEGSTLRARLFRSIRVRSLTTMIMAFFAITAFVVSVTGLTAVVASAVARQRREIAIRAALGAARPSLRRLLMREALLPAIVGSTVGLGAALYLVPSLENLTYGVSPHDPASFAAAICTTAVVVGYAAWASTRPALTMSPVDILRTE